MADHELIDDEERERFAGTSATQEPGGVDADTPGGTTSGADDRSSAYEEGRRSTREPGRMEDFRQGREDEGSRDEDSGFFARFRRGKDREPTRRD